MDFKRIDCVGEWLAVVNIPLTTALELPDDVKLANEGVIVGLGPDVRGKGLAVGDRVVLANKRYIEITPQSGGYEGMVVYIMRLCDVLIRKPPGDNYEIDESEWQDSGIA